MGAHTPGLWSVSLNIADRFVVIAEYDDPVSDASVIETVCEVWSGSEADARLIAAAKDLLLAAKDAAQELVEMEDMNHVQRMEWFEGRGLELYDVLCAAIEKAVNAKRVG